MTCSEEPSHVARGGLRKLFLEKKGVLNPAIYLLGESVPCAGDGKKIRGEGWGATRNQASEGA